MVAGLPNVFEHVCLERRSVSQFLTSLGSLSNLSARSFTSTSTRSTLRASVIGRSYQWLGLLSGWSERIDDAKSLQPPA